MLRKVILYGKLAKKYGKEHKLDVASYAEAMKAMMVNFKDFANDIRNEGWICLRNEEELIPETLSMKYKKGDFHLMPEAIGAKKGWLGVVLGVILVAVAWWNPLGWGAAATCLGMFGASLALSGIASLLTSAPTLDTSAYGQREEANSRPSHLFNGPVNLYEQGHPIPVLYGEMLMGSHTVSASIKIVDD